MTTYEATARRWAQGWELHIAGPAGKVGVTQCRTLDGAEFMARDYTALFFDVPADSFDVDVVVELGGQRLDAEAARELAGIERSWRGPWARFVDRFRRAR